MIKVKYIHRVCGFCIVYHLCDRVDCLLCPVHKLLELAKYKLAHPAPKSPEDDDESAND